MDERLEKALALSNYRVTIEQRRKAIKRRFETMTIVHCNNGMFRADQETIAFVKTLIDAGHNDAILVDVKANPIEIEDLEEFQKELLNKYFEATNEYMIETAKLAKARTVKKAMDW